MHVEDPSHVDLLQVELSYFSQEAACEYEKAHSSRQKLGCDCLSWVDFGRRARVVPFELPPLVSGFRQSYRSGRFYAGRTQ